MSNPLGQLTTQALGSDIAAHIVKAHGPEGAADLMELTYQTDNLFRTLGVRNFDGVKNHTWRDRANQSIPAGRFAPGELERMIANPLTQYDGGNRADLAALRNYVYARNDFFNHSREYYENLGPGDRPAVLAAIEKVDGKAAADTIRGMFPYFDAIRGTQHQLNALAEQRKQAVEKLQVLQVKDPTFGQWGDKNGQAIEDQRAVIDGIESKRASLMGGNYAKAAGELNKRWNQFVGGGDGKAAPEIGLAEQHLRAAYMAHLPGRTLGAPNPHGAPSDPSLNFMERFTASALGKQAACSTPMPAEAMILEQINTRAADRFLSRAPYGAVGDNFTVAWSKVKARAATMMADQSEQGPVPHLIIQDHRMIDSDKALKARVGAGMGKAIDEAYKTHFQGRPLGITSADMHNGSLDCTPSTQWLPPSIASFFHWK